MLITESLFDSPLRLVEESREDGNPQLFIEGVFLSTATNKNRRRYPKEVLEEALEDFQEKIKEGRAFGCLGHDDKAEVDLSKVSHRIVSMEWDKGDRRNVRGKALVLEDTPMGKILGAILRSGGTIGASAKGTGRTRKGEKGELIVESGYRIHGIDAVLSPSTNQMLTLMIEEYEGDPEDLLTESEAFEKAFVEYLKRKPYKTDEPVMGRLKRSKVDSEDSGVDAVSDWLKEFGHTHVKQGTAQAFRQLLMGGLHRALLAAHKSHASPQASSL
jgi:hypothetical protein